jgi:hypothetical protein
MAEEFDLLVDVPAFPAYALPPDAFPGFSAGSYGGSGGTSGIASVEYLYRPDYEPRGRVLGVSNTRPQEATSFFGTTRRGGPARRYESARSSRALSRSRRPRWRAPSCSGA